MSHDVPIVTIIQYIGNNRLNQTFLISPVELKRHTTSASHMRDTMNLRSMRLGTGGSGTVTSSSVPSYHYSITVEMVLLLSASP